MGPPSTETVSSGYDSLQRTLSKKAWEHGQDYSHKNGYIDSNCLHTLWHSHGLMYRWCCTRTKRMHLNCMVIHVQCSKNPIIAVKKKSRLTSTTALCRSWSFAFEPPILNLSISLQPKWITGGKSQSAKSIGWLYNLVVGRIKGARRPPLHCACQGLGIR